jgi:hypothetical protein
MDDSETWGRRPAGSQACLVGRDFADYEMVQGRVRTGSAIILKRYATGRHDRNAITCWFPHPELGEVRIGYLDRDTAEALAPLMDAGVKLDAVVERFSHDITVRIRRKRKPRR